MRRIASGTEISGGCVAALGTFDGVHLGHQKLLNEARREADESRLPLLVFSVDRHPEELPGGETGVLTDPEEKARLLAECGVDFLLSRPLSAIRDLSPETFCRTVLAEECGVKTAVCGFDFRFGKNAAGNAETLARHLSSLGAKTLVVPPVPDETGEKISSSAIRRALSDGNAEKARALLGRPYSILLPVVHGKGLGKGLGFATLNQKIPARFAPLRRGVYAVKALLSGKEFSGVCNVGVRPTFSRGDDVVAETHLFDFHEEVYGTAVRVLFYHFLREETTFASPEALKLQVERDKERAKAYFAQKNG